MAETKTSPQQVSWRDKKIKMEDKMKSMKVGDVFWQSGGRSKSEKRAKKIGKGTEFLIELPTNLKEIPKRKTEKNYE